MERVKTIVSNIEKEIEDLKEKKKGFEDLLDKMEKNKGNSHNHKNTTTNGSLEDSEGYEKKEVEKVRSQ